jgi:hypothetical protein
MAASKRKPTQKGTTGSNKQQRRTVTKPRVEEDEEESDQEMGEGQVAKGFDISTSRGDNVSELNTGESVTADMWKVVMDKMKTMEERLKNVGGVSVVSGDTVTPPPSNEGLMKENIRKFVTGKVFPSWKFIFKKQELEKCVVSAINKGYITVPIGYEDGQVAKHYSPTVRVCLDGCRANAQSAARKRYLSK